MGFLLERCRPEADLDEVAREYVAYQARRGELRWHPRLITALRVAGVDHLRDALGEGRGAVVNFIHHGYYDGAFPSIARRGVPLTMVAHGYMLEPDAPAWLRQHVAVAETGGNVAVSAGIGAAGLRDLLQQGRPVALASDVPGGSAVSFVGRELFGSSGAARLACETGAPVVVLTSEEDGEGPFVRLHPPLDPARFGSPAQLLDSMLAVHEQVVLRWPAAADLPLSRWGTSSRRLAAGARP
jgi:KDO2-lipid IV(A) lauroyltransferase